ncbi:MAG: serine O-acetyltransferase [Bacteroidales bacterium]|nr:serine O-acetyltransferase [Clostridium sp.]MCM1204448.1 serine O-acetyltransferase [Bacteroidales bacterium]
MNKQFNEILPDIVDAITHNYTQSDLLLGKSAKQLPVRSVIIEILNDLQRLIFPGYFSTESVDTSNAAYYTGHMLSNLHGKLKKQIALALAYDKEDIHSVSIPEIQEQAEHICNSFLSAIPDIQTLLLLDVQAGYDGDPAADNREQIIFSYPGFYAVFVYRIAHELYRMHVPFIPRIMTEHAHGKTGIDINSGASIGRYFFMDHGTGIVIGETTVIGDYVKLYQGVTLGALSTRGGQHLAGVKRHPTIEDRVTIYANATILGGETVIGRDSVVGGGAFITDSIPANTRVTITPPDLSIKNETTGDISATSYIYEI